MSKTGLVLLYIKKKLKQEEQNDLRLIIKLAINYFQNFILPRLKKRKPIQIEKEAIFVFSEPLTIKYTVSPDSGEAKTALEERGLAQDKTIAKKRISTINEKYTFSNFIEGSHNEFAKAAAIASAKLPVWAVSTPKPRIVAATTVAVLPKSSPIAVDSFNIASCAFKISCGLKPSFDKLS